MDGLVNVTMTKEAVGRLINLCQILITEGQLHDNFEEAKIIIQVEDALQKALAGEDPHRFLGGFGVPCPGCGKR